MAPIFNNLEKGGFDRTGVSPDEIEAWQIRTEGRSMRRKTSHPYPVTIARDFKEFLEVPTSKGERAIVVGGHAANLWAMHYLHKEPELLKHAPFTSKDLDFVGDSKTAITLARMVN